MLYLISGASRVGKTIIAKKLSIQKGINYLSLDWLMMGFTNGIPEYGIHDKLMPDEIAKRLWSFLEAMCESMLWTGENCILEGEAMLPELLVELLKKHPKEIKVCFLGYTNVSIDEKVRDIKDFSSKKKDWLSDKSDEYIIDHIQNMMAHSVEIEKSCKENNIAYFDVSTDFSAIVEDAVKYLLM